MCETKNQWEESNMYMSSYRCEYKSKRAMVSVCLKDNVRLSDELLDWSGKFVAVWACDTVDLTGLVTMPDIISIGEVGKLILPPNWVGRIKAIDLYRVGSIEIKSSKIGTLDANTQYNHDSKTLEYVRVTKSLHDMKDAVWFDIINLNGMSNSVCYIDFEDTNIEVLRLEGLRIQGLFVSECPKLLFIHNTNCYTSLVYLRDLESLYDYTNRSVDSVQHQATGFMCIVKTPNLYRLIDDNDIYNLHLGYPSCWINKLLAKVTNLTLKEPITVICRLRKLYYTLRHYSKIKTITIKG